MSSITTDSETAASLQHRAQTLLDELSAFQTFLQSQHLSNPHHASTTTPTQVEIRHFTSNVRSELRSLERLSSTATSTFNSSLPDANTAADALRASGSTTPGLEYTESPFSDPEGEAEADSNRRLHALRSSNLPFYEAVWTVAKQCRGVIAVGKRVCLEIKDDDYEMEKSGPGGPEFTTDMNGSSKGTASVEDRFNGSTVKQIQKRKSVKPKKTRKGSVLIDVVADGGGEWVKVSTVTAKRLWFEVAREGWERYAEADSGEEGYDQELDSEKPELELMRLARDLYFASLQVRVRFQHPRVRLLLPKVCEGEHRDVDTILRDLRRVGASVECGGFFQREDVQEQQFSSAASESFATMLPMPEVLFTDTINIDCTLLLALISDISHNNPKTLPDPPQLRNNHKSYHSAILAQIAAEEKSPLLLTILYPLLVGRYLICTTHAANRALEIVETMGTPSEQKRADILLGGGEYLHMEMDTLRKLMQQNSVHHVPDDLQIRILQASPEDGPKSHSMHTHFPAETAKRVVESMNLSAINKSVFMYGWSQDIVTVTSNQAVVGRLIQTINRVLDDMERPARDKGVVDRHRDFHGPRIWVCDTARSLIGKHKRA